MLNKEVHNKFEFKERRLALEKQPVTDWTTRHRQTGNQTVFRLSPWESRAMQSPIRPCSPTTWPTVSALISH